MATMTADDGSDDDLDPTEFYRAMAEMPEDEFMEYLDSLPEPQVIALMRATSSFDSSTPDGPLEQAMELDAKFVSRPHLEYLSKRIAIAVKDVERGISRMLMVSMPPRSGKSALISENLPIWLLRKHPDWKYGLLSYTPQLATAWSRAVRKVIQARGAQLGVEVAPDAGAVGDWNTTAGGEVHARSMAQGLTGYGANVMLIDDPIKDSIVAASENYRKMIWERWTGNLQTRLEGAFLVIVVQTRWHEDDLSGRLQNPKIEGSNPEEWEVISFPAIAEENDVLGRQPGDPLFPPLLPMLRDKALEWWDRLKRSMSSYDWSAQFQQRPAPAQGAIFNTDWWRYWTKDPSRVTYKLNPDGSESSVPDGRVVLLPPISSMALLDSWDLNFDDTEGADFVVGQRWGMAGQDRFLLEQRRGRWDFPETLSQFEKWNSDRIVFKHLVEKKANGAAMIKMLMNKFSGFKPVNPTSSKENRARAVTAEIESGHVRLPLLDETPWMVESGLLDELRAFPTGANDDQVDTLTQALMELRGDDFGGISNPAEVQREMARVRSGNVRDETTGERVEPIRSPLTTRTITRNPGGFRGR